MTTFTTKDWRDSPDVTTPISAAALEDLETRVTSTGGRTITVANATHTPLTLKGAGGQSAPLLRLTDSTDSVLARINQDGHLGLGADPVTYRLHVHETGLDHAALISGVKHSLSSAHTADLEGEPMDLCDFTHWGTGDALFVAHLGGAPVGYGGTTGGNAGLNIGIPYIVGDTSLTLTEGTVNDRAGMKGIFIQNQPASAANSILIQHSTDDPAIYLQVQPDDRPYSGAGGGISIEDHSTADSIVVTKEAAPAASKATLVLHDAVVGDHDMFRIEASTGQPTLLVDSSGFISSRDKTTGNYTFRMGGSYGNAFAFSRASDESTIAYMAPDQFQFITTQGKMIEGSGDSLWINEAGGKLRFYDNGVAVAKQTGVAVSAAGIHAALVNLGLISA